MKKETYICIEDGCKNKCQIRIQGRNEYALVCLRHLLPKCFRFKDANSELYDSRFDINEI